MTPEEIGMTHFGIALRDNGFSHAKTAEELTNKTMAAVAVGIRAAVEAEREACALAADSIANDYWDMFKGRGKHAPNNPMRADPYADGASHGAEESAAVIRHRGNA